ncbi:RNA polymerase sigma factor [Cytobacillus massiliigabonensis]|uniref:RNA polymerase sigma factor n=1 Tax=Cytobacillus massiliigabonensis TaxID=1871011 RepID=UPI000C83BC7A|nr:hypothetical protein [Cytobacillus massiliigabonensis]
MGQIEESEFQAIINEYNDYLLQLSYLYVKEWNSAEDIVQDVFINYWLKSNEFKGKSNRETIELPVKMFSSFLNYVLENKYVEQEDVLSTLRYIDVKNETTLNKSFIVTFDCGRTACASAFMIVNEKMQIMTPLGEGTITSELMYSPDNENVMFLLSNADKTKQRIVVINLKSNSQSRIPTANHEYFSYYNWSITNIVWLTNKKISLTVANIEPNSNEAIKQWLQKSDKPTNTIEITLPYK